MTGAWEGRAECLVLAVPEGRAVLVVEGRMATVPAILRRMRVCPWVDAVQAAADLLQVDQGRADRGQVVPAGQAVQEAVPAVVLVAGPVMADLECVQPGKAAQALCLSATIAVIPVIYTC